MTKDIETPIIIGKFGSAYGILGWVKVISYAENETNILDYSPWYIANGEALELEGGKPHGKGLIVKIRGINSPEEAKYLAGKEITIKRSQLKILKENEYYWSDLIGLNVINQHGKYLGKVIYLLETGSNDVLVVKDQKEIAIPFLVNSVIVQIDLDKKEILVNWE